MAFVSVDQMPHFEGNRGTKTLLGNREHKKCLFPGHTLPLAIVAICYK